MLYTFVDMYGRILGCSLRASCAASARHRGALEDPLGALRVLREPFEGPPGSSRVSLGLGALWVVLGDLSGGM